jgi:DNA-binding LytR/AlgR family response regulator
MNRSLSVIIAEDKPFDRELLEKYAGQLGLKVVSSLGSGELLIEDAIKYVPDLLFLDIGLSGSIDGLTAFKRILENGQSPYLILVSGTTDVQLILDGVSMNCIDFVTKPVTFDRLKSAVENAKTIIRKDLPVSKAVSGKIIQIKSNYRTIFINENKLIYAQKLKSERKSVIFVEGESEYGIETKASLSEIQSQCSEFIFSPNQSNLINVNYIKKVFARVRLLSTYVIQLDHNNVEIELSRRRRKEFEHQYSRVTLNNKIDENLLS